MIKKQENLARWKHVQQKTHIQSDFQIDARLFDKQDMTGDKILSGSIDFQSSWYTYDDIDTRETQLSGKVFGIQDGDESVQIDISARLQAFMKNNDVYFQLQDITLKQDPKKSQQLTLRYLLLKEYKQTFIHIDRAKVPFINLFSPDRENNIISKNNKKIRILSDK